MLTMVIARNRSGHVLESTKTIQEVNAMMRMLAKIEPVISLYRLMPLKGEKRCDKSEVLILVIRKNCDQRFSVERTD